MKTATQPKSKTIRHNAWKIEVHEAVMSPKQYYFNIIAGNGEVVATSETYKNIKDCKDTARSIQCNVYSAKIVMA